MPKKKIWANFQRIIELFTQKIVTKLSKIWVWDSGYMRAIIEVLLLFASYACLLAQWEHFLKVLSQTALQQASAILINAMDPDLVNP